MKSLFWTVIGFILLYVLTDVLITFSPVLYRDVQKLEYKPKVVYTGHRGAACYAPENTLPSIDTALKLGVDRVEVDVHQTKDGHVVIIHDATVDRTTNGTGKVKDLTLEQIEKLDAGSWFSPKFKGTKIPTLEQAFELINGKAVFVIELKHGSDVYPGIEQKVADLIRKYNAYDWVVIHSFDDKVLEKFHEIDSNITLHKLFVFKLNMIPLMYDTHLHFASLKKYKYCKELSVYYKFTNPYLIKRAHVLGFKVNAWTVDKPVTGLRLVNYKTDGIISNCPDKIKAAIDSAYQANQ